MPLLNDTPSTSSLVTLQAYQDNDFSQSKALSGRVLEYDLHPQTDQPSHMEHIAREGMSEASLYRHNKALYAMKKKARRLTGDDEVAVEEVRVISSIILRCHDNNIGVGQWEWGEDQIPTFSTFYAEQGTVRDFFRQNTGIFLTQKRNFAIDIASGLYALHAADIAHGDINLDNTLVFPHPDNDGSWIAKVSNFAQSVFGLSSQRLTSYPAVALYSAPEVRDRDGQILSDQLVQCESFSYGLLVWEIAKDGEIYFDPSWIQEASDTHKVSCQEEYLKTLPNDGLLKHALSFLCSRYTNSKCLDVNLFYHVLALTLKDNPSGRKDLATIALSLDYCDRYAEVTGGTTFVYMLIFILSMKQS